MKSKNVLKMLTMLFALSALLVFTGCDSGEDDCETTVFYEDADNDGLGNPDSMVEECEQPEGYVTNADDDNDGAAPSQTLAELATANSSLSTLVSFVAEDEELLGYLTGSTDYTVFAPNDAAFEILRQTLGVESLLDVAPSVIGDVLRFHFHAGKVYASGLGDDLMTLQGESIAFNEAEEGAIPTILTGCTNTEVAVIGSSLATNGIVHIVDRILIPPTVCTAIGSNLGRLTQPLLLSSAFSEIARLIVIADMNPAVADADKIAAVLSNITSENGYTVFAPANAVLDAVAAGNGISREQLIASIVNTDGQPDPVKARGFLLNHVTADGSFTKAEILATVDATTGVGTTIQMLSGLSLTVVAGPTNSSAPGCTDGGDNCVYLAGDVTNTETYIPIFQTDVYKATVEGNQLDGAINGSLHVSAPITLAPQGN